MDDSSLNDAAFEERFLLLGKMEILSLLQDLLHHREAVSISFNNGRDNLLSQLLKVRNDGIVFDASIDPALNRRLVASDRLVFRARPDGVPVHFVAAAPTRVAWDGGEALWVSLPDRIARMQRREIYRVTAPIAKPLNVAIETETGETLRLPLHDLSVAGFGLSLAAEMAFPEVGTALPLVSIHLPDKQWLELKGVVRHLTPIVTSAKPRYRAGIALQAVDGRSEASLQRLVIRLDQEHHKLSRDD